MPESLLVRTLLFTVEYRSEGCLWLLGTVYYTSSKLIHPLLFVKFCLSIYVFVNLCAHVCKRVHALMEVRGQQWIPLSVSLCLRVWVSLSLNLELTSSARLTVKKCPWICPSLPHPSAETIEASYNVWIFLLVSGSELRASCLHSKHFARWVISKAHPHSFCMIFSWLCSIPSQSHQATPLKGSFLTEKQEQVST